MWVERLKLLLAGLITGSVLLFYIIPMTQSVIPYDSVRVIQEGTRPLSDNEFIVNLEFRKTACGFDDLFVMVNTDTGWVQGDWHDAENVAGVGNRAEGWHVVNIVVETPQNIMAEKDPAILILSDHFCDIEERDNIGVVSKALPGYYDMSAPNKWKLTKVLARIEL